MPLKTANLSSSQEKIKKERTNAKMLYSNLHTYAIVCTYIYIHIITIIMIMIRIISIIICLSRNFHSFHYP